MVRGLLLCSLLVSLGALPAVAGDTSLEELIEAGHYKRARAEER